MVLIIFKIKMALTLSLIKYLDKCHSEANPEQKFRIKMMEDQVQAEVRWHSTQPPQNFKVVPLVVAHLNQEGDNHLLRQLDRMLQRRI